MVMLQTFIFFSDVKELRHLFKKINTTFWHPNQKLLSIMNTQEHVVLLKNLFGKNYKTVHELSPTPIEKRPLSQYAIEELFRLEKALVLKKYSASSIRTYRNMFSVFLTKSPSKDISPIGKEEIEGVVYELITKKKWRELSKSTHKCY
jgi:integrase/recombinase XerD